MKKTPDLTEEEMIEILKDIARNSGNDSARRAVIRDLREIEAGKQTPGDAFDKLDELAPRRTLRTKAV